MRHAPEMGGGGVLMDLRKVWTLVSMYSPCKLILVKTFFLLVNLLPIKGTLYLIINLVVKTKSRMSKAADLYQTKRAANCRKISPSYPKL